jgi:hypothetical protein
MKVRNNRMTVFEVSFFTIIWMEALNFFPYLCNLLYLQAFMMCPWQVIYCPLCTLHAHCYMLKVQLTRMHLCCILDKFCTPKGSLTPVFLCLCLLWNPKHALNWLVFVYMSVEQPLLTQGILWELKILRPQVRWW